MLRLCWWEAGQPNYLEGKWFRVIKVKSRGNEPLEKLLKRFKKKCEKEGLIKDIKRCSFYEKPSERRRRKVRKAIKRAAKLAAEFGPVR